MAQRLPAGRVTGRSAPRPSSVIPANLVIRSVEDEQWSRSDPEKSARADDMVSKLEAAIAEIEADLEAAKAAGDQKKAAQLEENLASRQSFLDMARRVSADYS